MDESIEPGSAHSRVDGPGTLDRRTSGRRRTGFLLASLAGSVLIAAWIGLFAASVRQDGLAFGSLTWVPLIPCLGGDFKLHLYHIAYVHSIGINPYYVQTDWICMLYPYPPMLTRLFLWAPSFDLMVAAPIWQGATALFVGLGCWSASRARRAFGLEPIPLPLMIASVLFSTPFLFSVDRGQCDPMIIPSLIVASWLLTRRGAWSELAAGGLLGLTAWIKYYPGLVVVALFALGRRRAMVGFAVVAVLIGIVDYKDVLESIKHGKILEGIMVGHVRSVHVVSHSFAEAWKVNSLVQGSPLLRQIPSAVLPALLLIPAVTLVCRSMARSRQRGDLILPFFLWMAAAGTFALPYSNDYNLVTLPIAIFATWDRRDRVAVQVALALSVIWFQPIGLPISGDVLIFFKLGALYAAGFCLTARASREGTRSDSRAGESLFRPAYRRHIPTIAQADVISVEPAPGPRQP